MVGPEDHQIRSRVMPRGKTSVYELIEYLTGLVETDEDVDDYIVIMEHGDGTYSPWNGKVHKFPEQQEILLEIDS
jgi:hypothetical protein